MSIPHFIWVGVKLKIPTKCVCGGGALGIYFLRGGWSSIFDWRGEGSSRFQGGG